MESLESLGLFGLFLGNLLAATVVPFSSDALYIASLKLMGQPLACFLTASAGNWIGGMITYGMGYAGRTEWLERWFRVKPETIERQKRHLEKYGVWMALITWVPVIGDVVALALGFYKVKPLWSAILMLIGKAGRFAVWTLLLLN